MVSATAECVIACNVTRRNMSTGARAMATALVLAEDGQRIAGKWDGARSRSLIRGSSSTNSESSWVKAMTQCGVVIDYLPALAQQVVDGELALDGAYRQACDARNATRRNIKTSQRAMATALVLAADGRRDSGRWAYGAQKVANVAKQQSASSWRVAISECGTIIDFAPDLAELVRDGELTLDAALREAEQRRDAERRNMSTGARAMATALVLQADGRRENGRWRRGTKRVGINESVDTSWEQRLTECGIVLDFKSDLADAVVAGTVTLNDAFTQADKIRTSAERDGHVLFAGSGRHGIPAKRREPPDPKVERLPHEVACLGYPGSSNRSGAVDGTTVRTGR